MGSENYVKADPLDELGRLYVRLAKNRSDYDRAYRKASLLPEDQREPARYHAHKKACERHELIVAQYAVNKMGVIGTAAAIIELIEDVPQNAMVAVLLAALEKPERLEVDEEIDTDEE
jgi:predicted DCC family thiol-disulfide oxidoreductase YuxK